VSSCDKLLTLSSDPTLAAIEPAARPLAATGSMSVSPPRARPAGSSQRAQRSPAALSWTSRVSGRAHARPSLVRRFSCEEGPSDAVPWVVSEPGAREPCRRQSGQAGQQRSGVAGVAATRPVKADLGCSAWRRRSSITARQKRELARAAPGNTRLADRSRPIRHPRGAHTMRVNGLDPWMSPSCRDVPPARRKWLVIFLWLSALSVIAAPPCGRRTSAL